MSKRRVDADGNPFVPECKVTRRGWPVYEPCMDNADELWDAADEESIRDGTEVYNEIRHERLGDETLREQREPTQIERAWEIRFLIRAMYRRGKCVHLIGKHYGLTRHSIRLALRII